MAEIPSQPEVRAVMDDMHPDGYWLQRNPRTGKETGAGVEYGAYASTHYRLSYLAELGMDRSDPRVDQAAGRYLDLQAEDGDFWMHMSCLLGLNLRTFAMLGYGDDPRVAASLSLLLSTERPDGGYLCDIHEKPARGKSGRALKRPKSCFRGSVKALLGLSYYPKFQDHPRVQALTEYFLERGGIFRRDDPSSLVTKDVGSPSFPVTWSADLVQVLYALSRLRLGADPRLDRAWNLLDSMQDSEGFLPLSWTPRQSPWKVGKPGEPSDWLTLYADIARADRYSSSPVAKP